MWQPRSLYLSCLCWLLIKTTDTDKTVYFTQGSQSILQCPLSSVIANTSWIGPPQNTPYNIVGTTILNQKLPADFLSRLAIHPITGALIINNTQKSDDNWYFCKLGGESLRVKLTVLVSPQPPFIVNSSVNNSVGRMVVWAMEDSWVSLVCQCNGGDPQPSLKWIKGGVTWSEVSANISVQNNTNGTYDVTSTTMVMTYISEDRMTYVCQANHTTWSSPQNASVELYLYLRPKEQVLSEQVSLSEGGNLTVKCTVTGCRPEANLTWTGLQGRQMQTNTLILEDETYNVTSLYTSTVNRQDNGVILRCTVTHLALTSSLTASSTVVVLFPPTNVSITNNREVTAGYDTLILRCTTGTANPIAEIFWRNGTSSGPAGVLSPEIDESGAYFGKIKYQNLTITPTRYMDGNTITCSTQNSQSFGLNVSDSVNLKVKYSPITVISNGSVLSVTEGDTNVALVCNAESKPVSSFMWVKDNVTLKTTRPESENRDTYIISLVNRTHYGQYSCIANNSISPNGQGNISLNVLFAPTNVKITNNRNVTAGQGTLILTCTTGTANPIADISWRNGTSGVPTGNLSTKMEHHAAYGGKIQTQNLTITPTRYMDESTITCSAKSTGAVISDSAILNVKFSPVIEISLIPNMIITEGDIPVTIRCSATSNPISYFTLEKDGQTTAISEGQGSHDNHHDYTIQRINRTHAGRYSCTANNGVEGPEYEVKATLELVVQYPPSITLSASNVTTNDVQARLECLPHGVPNRYNFSAWQHLWPGYNDTLRSLSSTYVNQNNASLYLNSLSYQDSGIYVCQASNGIKVAGTQNDIITQMVYILVKAPPLILKIAKEIGGYIGGFVVIQLEYYSNTDVGLVTLQHSNSSILYRAETVDVIQVNSLKVQMHYVPAKIYSGNFNISIDEEGDFGLYTVNISNSIGFNISTLEIKPEGPPGKPYNFNSSNPQLNQITLSWYSGFHGGFSQTFVIQISLDNILWHNASLIPGGMLEGKELFNTTVTELKPNTIYYFRIYAFNLKGNGNMADEVITDKTLAELVVPPTAGPQTIAIVGGAVGGSVVALALVVVLVLFLRRRTSTSGKQMGRGPIQRERPESGLVDNPVYDSSDPQTGASAGSAGADYAVVVRSRKMAGQVDGSSNLYAQVDMKHKKKMNESNKGKQRKVSRGDIYENADFTTKGTTPDNLYENSGDSVHEDSWIATSAGPLVNKESLHYADLMLDPPVTKNGKPIIRGIENCTEYAKIAYGKKGQPLPDSDDETQKTG